LPLDIGEAPVEDPAFVFATGCDRTQTLGVCA